MSWGITAVVGSTVSGVGSLVGAGLSYRASRKATKAASKASGEQLAFEYEKYDDWNEVYGPIQDNLASYYENVSPDYYASVGLEEFETQYQTSLDRIDENLTQRGIDPSSGIGASIESQAELGAAETRAGIRRDAPRKAAEDKTNFLQIGLGQNPGNSISSAMAQRSEQTADAANIASEAAGSAIAAAIPAVGRAVGTAAGAYYGRS